jgi:hypothetical protein
MDNFMEIIVEPINPQSPDYKLSRLNVVYDYDDAYESLRADAQNQSGNYFYNNSGAHWRGDGPDPSKGTQDDFMSVNAKGEAGYWSTPEYTPDFGKSFFGVDQMPEKVWNPYGGEIPTGPQQPTGRDTSQDPSWWNTGGGMSGGQAPAPVPRPAPVNPSYGSQPTNPMMQMLGNRGGKTVTGPQQALATALRGG